MYHINTKYYICMKRHQWKRTLSWPAVKTWLQAVKLSVLLKSASLITHLTCLQYNTCPTWKRLKHNTEGVQLEINACHAFAHFFDEIQMQLTGTFDQKVSLT